MRRRRCCSSLGLKLSQAGWHGAAFSGAAVEPAGAAPARPAAGPPGQPPPARRRRRPSRPQQARLTGPERQETGKYCAPACICRQGCFRGQQVDSAAAMRTAATVPSYCTSAVTSYVMSVCSASTYFDVPLAPLQRLLNHVWQQTEIGISSAGLPSSSRRRSYRRPWRHRMPTLLQRSRVSLPWRGPGQRLGYRPPGRGSSSYLGHSDRRVISHVARSFVPAAAGHAAYVQPL